MPRGDRTGPAGMGPMTGRAAGYCAGYGTPGYINPAFGGGFGMGAGRGWGFRGIGFGGGRGRRFAGAGRQGWWRPFGSQGTPYGYEGPYGSSDPAAEEKGLRDQARALQSELEAVNRRLSELDAASK